MAGPGGGGAGPGGRGGRGGGKGGKDDKKEDKKPQKGKKQTRRWKKARRDVKLQFADVLGGFGQEKQAVKGAYGGAQKALQEMPEYDTGDIQQGLLDYVGNLNLAGGLGPQENVAGSAALWGGPAGAAGVLAAQEARQKGYQQSALREAGLSGRVALENVAMQKQDFLQRMPQLIKQRFEELRQQAIENKLLKSQMESDQALVDFVMSQIKSMR